MLAIQEKENSVEDGCILLNIREKMKELNLSKKEVLEESGLKNEVFNRYYYSDIKRIDRRILAKFCKVLKCNVDEIITYKD